MIEASGVRRSCEIEVSSEPLSFSVSASMRAWSTSFASRMRSAAIAARSASASSRRRSAGVSRKFGVSRLTPMTPTRPWPVRSGRNRRRALGSVSVPRPVAWLWSRHQVAAARSASSSWLPAGALAICTSAPVCGFGSIRIASTLSMFATCAAVAAVSVSSLRMPASLRLKANSSAVVRDCSLALSE